MLGHLYMWKIKYNDIYNCEHLNYINKEQKKQKIYSHKNKYPYLDFDYDYQNDLFIGTNKKYNIVLYSNKCRE